MENEGFEAVFTVRAGLPAFCGYSGRAGNGRIFGKEIFDEKPTS